MGGTTKRGTTFLKFSGGKQKGEGHDFRLKVSGEKKLGRNYRGGAHPCKL